MEGDRGRLWTLLLAAFVAIVSSEYEVNDKTNLSVMTWNILAPIWVNRKAYESYGQTDMNLLDDEIRLKLVTRHIVDTEVDIVLLQEVQEDTFVTIRKEIDRYYTAVAFAANEKNYWREDWLQKGHKYIKNGVATFYRKNKFKLQSHKIVPTSDLGSTAILSTLLPVRRSFSANGNGFGSPVLVVNCHLDAGYGPKAVRRRVRQGTAIATAVSKALQKLKGKNAVTVWAGDINSVSGDPGVENIKEHGYYDAMEALGIYPPTVYLGASNKGRSIDHLFISKSDVAKNKIEYVSVHVPDIYSRNYSEEGHNELLITMLSEELSDEGIESPQNIISYLLTSKLFSKLYASHSDSLNYDNFNRARSLRLGSDHLPLTVVLKVKISAAALRKGQPGKCPASDFNFGNVY